MEKKKFHILPVVLVTLLLLSISAVAVWAAINSMSTKEVKNTFEPAVTSVQVLEEFDGIIKSNVCVKNTGSTGEPIVDGRYTTPRGPAVYVRVRLLPYWYDAVRNQIVGITSWTPSFTAGEDWSKIGDYYYYAKPIEAGEITSDLIDSITLETDTDGNRQVLEVIAESIQSNPKEAVTEAWGVSVDSNGSITGAAQ